MYYIHYGSPHLWCLYYNGEDLDYLFVLCNIKIILELFCDQNMNTSVLNKSIEYQNVI